MNRVIKKFLFSWHPHVNTSKPCHFHLKVFLCKWGLRPQHWYANASILTQGESHQPSPGVDPCVAWLEHVYKQTYRNAQRLSLPTLKSGLKMSLRVGLLKAQKSCSQSCWYSWPDISQGLSDTAYQETSTSTPQRQQPGSDTAETTKRSHCRP